MSKPTKKKPPRPDNRTKKSLTFQRPSSTSQSQSSPPAPSSSKATSVPTTRSRASQRSNAGNVDVRRQARIEGYFGTTGAGKSASIKKVLDTVGADPLMIFDVGHEYEMGNPTTNEAEFLNSITSTAYRTFRPSFNAELRERQFDRFCSSALALLRATGRATIVADELQEMTRPGWAPRYWGELVRTGRKIGATLLLGSQRPALIDKTSWSLLTRVQTGRLNFDDDATTLGKLLRVPADEIVALPNLHFIWRDLATGGEAQRGVLTF